MLIIVMDMIAFYVFKKKRLCIFCVAADCLHISLAIGSERIMNLQAPISHLRPLGFYMSIPIILSGKSQFARKRRERSTGNLIYTVHKLQVEAALPT